MSVRVVVPCTRSAACSPLPLRAGERARGGTRRRGEASSDGTGGGSAGGGVGAHGVPGAVRGVSAHPERAVGNSQLSVSEMQAAAGAAAAVAIAGVSARN